MSQSQVLCMGLLMVVAGLVAAGAGLLMDRLTRRPPQRGLYGDLFCQPLVFGLFVMAAASLT